MKYPPEADQPWAENITKSSMGNRKILVSLTSLSVISEKKLPGWRSKTEEINKFGLEEIALFLTGLEKKERTKLFKALENTSVKSIPHVHLRTDMEPQELDYLSKKYDVKAFNLHSTAQWPLQHDYGKYFPMIYLENTWDLPNDKELTDFDFGGICVDFTHWEGKRLEKDDNYCKRMEYLVDNYKIGCSHVSAIKDKPTPIVIDRSILEFDSHELEDLRELDYISKYILYLPEIVSIELENSIAEQIEIKKYLEKIISDKENE